MVLLQKGLPAPRRPRPVRTAQDPTTLVAPCNQLCTESEINQALQGPPVALPGRLPAAFRGRVPAALPGGLPARVPVALPGRLPVALPGRVPACHVDESAQRYYCSGLALTSVEC